MANMPMAEDDPLKGKKSGKWSKYGSSVSGLVKEKLGLFWYCQVCGIEQPKELKPFLFEMSQGEYIRLCGKCTHASKYEDSVLRIRRVRRIVISKS